MCRVMVRRRGSTGTTRHMAAVVGVLLLVGVTTSLATPASAVTTGPPTSTAVTVNAPVFAYYYLWWSRSHWLDMLGPAYPAGAVPLPLPAQLDADGCNPTSLYPGNRVDRRSEQAVQPG